MLEVLQSHINIGNFFFDFVHEVTIESSWQNLTDTAVVKLPAALKINANDLKQAIPAGSPVVIKLGYERYGLVEIFKGYVARVRNKVPIEIECEDEMWTLKKIEVNENCKNEYLGDYLERVLNVPVDCFKTKVPYMIVHGITGAKLLDKIKSEFGFHSFFREGTLMVGINYLDITHRQRHTLVLDNPVFCNVKEQNLEYMLKEDVKIKVKAISNRANGKKEEYEFGDADGDERTLNFYNLSSSELKKLAEEEAKKFKFDGYRGDLRLFGAPIVFHGDVLHLTNTQGSDKTGNYIVDKVIYKFGVDGFEQIVEPGPVVKEKSNNE